MAEGSKGIPVVVMGLGHIGQAIARAVLEQPELTLVGAVDPAHAGRRLAELAGPGAPNLSVAADARQALARARGGVLLHATGSSFEAVLPQLEAAVQAGLSVVSTCEELAYPWLHHEEQAEALDALCEERQVAVVGVGVNPGFALDRLPAFLAQVTGPVRHVRALRVQDTARRRPALQRRVGAGLDEEAFHAAADRGELGHVGLSESAMLAALGCGFELDEVEEELSPLIAEEDLAAALPVKAGQVAGVHQVARGFVEGTERVRLELVLAAGAEDPRDEVELDARPPVKVRVEGGLPGDEATAWSAVNAALRVSLLQGLVTVLDLPAGR
ncbi:NAD(P)H-dependent amine dehydrogenase family protein [Anaeromyxobacter diazotrophicus]|uniref:Oxidoreductase n=1 Tax=Anaeromyxobacter diazotrophicus TaxID=2590199 RepID=A0A7I9VSG4_9BACT|nr:dihydrodipicolinate reductase [Anaeromyxobacter diazotrophicus]GEJ59392.1 oxidoreductase [Anaeromyxobacter diazotrophicus]